MSDPIDRQAAINTAQVMYERCDENIEDYRDLMVESLKVLPSAQQWIPCSERLPETPDMVLITIDWGDGDYEVSTDEYWSIDGVETEGWGNLHGEVVTAWMPLPEPYKGEQE